MPQAVNGLRNSSTTVMRRMLASIKAVKKDPGGEPLSGTTITRGFGRIRRPARKPYSLLRKVFWFWRDSDPAKVEAKSQKESDLATDGHRWTRIKKAIALDRNLCNSTNTSPRAKGGRRTACPTPGELAILPCHGIIARKRYNDREFAGSRAK